MTTTLKLSEANNQNIDSSVDCFIVYLKSKNVHDEFLTIPRSSQSIVTQACQKGVEIEIRNLLEQAEFIVRNKNNVECLKSGMERHENLQYSLLNKRIVQSTNEGFARRFGKIFDHTKTPKDLALVRIEKKILEMIDSIEIKCQTMVDLENLFDSFFVDDVDAGIYLKNDEAQEFCIRKELTEKLFIDSTMLEMNSQENAICDKIIQQFKAKVVDGLKEFDSESTNKAKDICFYKKLTESSEFINHLLTVELLSSLSLTKSQISQEKKKFVSNMISITEFLRINCFG